ncbi:MAG: VWA domain-containing protein [Thermoleophilaceae bacterium]|nr:VWA domain-containing protein [Thermoleophilaceae bacterium]
MSFAEPLVLLGLLVLPLLIAAYAWHERGRRVAAAAFATPALQPSVAPQQPRWRRHAPMLAVCLALLVLILAAARPQRTVAVPVERASIVLATDVSGSMTATDVKPSRLVAAKRAAKRFAEAVPARVNVGVLAFNHRPRLLQSPTTDREAVSAAIESFEPSGSTAIGDAILLSAAAIVRPAAGRRRPPAAIVLLSDGKSARGSDPITAARAARRLRIPIYTVTLGTEAGVITVPRPGGGTQVERVPPAPESLARVARESGGEAFTADTASGLKNVYRKLGSQLAHRDEQRQVTSAFAGGGLLLLLAGVGMSLRWFGRMI